MGSLFWFSPFSGLSVETTDLDIESKHMPHPGAADDFRISLLLSMGLDSKQISRVLAYLGSPRSHATVRRRAQLLGIPCQQQQSLNRITQPVLSTLVARWVRSVGHNYGYRYIHSSLRAMFPHVKGITKRGVCVALTTLNPAAAQLRGSGVLRRRLRMGHIHAPY